MNDREIMQRINQLVEQEHELLEAAGEHRAGDDHHERLRTLHLEQEQLWDLLRQRRALRRAGRDPDEARLRDPQTVERYLQ